VDAKTFCPEVSGLYTDGLVPWVWQCGGIRAVANWSWVGPGMEAIRASDIMLSYCVKVLLTLLIIGVFACTVSAHEYTVEGDMVYTEYQQGHISIVTNYSFVVEVRDGSSKIRTVGLGSPGLDYAEYGWDKTNSYLLVKFSTNNSFKTVWQLEGGKTSSKELNTAIKPRNEATVKIYKDDPIPQYNFGFEPIWLAYASSSYFQKKKSGEKCEPVWDMGRRVRDSGIRFTSMWKLSDAAPHLLESMSDFADGNLYTTAGGRLVSERLNAPFNADYTNSLFKVLEWTNVAGMKLPLRFQATHYIPDTKATTEPILLPLRVYEGSITRIKPFVVSKSFAPNGPIATPTQVLDKRFAKADHDPVATISYFSPSGGVLSMEAIKTNEVYKQALGGREPVVSSKKSRYILISIIALSVIFPVWILTRNWGSREVNQNKNQ